MTAPIVTPAELATKFAQVVVPVDFSPLSWRVITLATRLSRAFGVPRRFIHVDTSSPWLDEGINRLVLRATPGGASVGVDVVAARTVANGIVRALGDDEASLLVMTSHGHTGATELATGSTTAAVLRQWNGPLVLAGPNYKSAPVPFRRVVYCVDPESSMTSPGLAADIQGWAAAYDIPVEVLAVFADPPTDFDALVTFNRRLDEAVEAVSTDERPATVVRLEDARPGRNIAAYADAVDGTLLALATHARPAAARAVLGSTAMAVLRHATSPMLVRRLTTR